MSSERPEYLIIGRVTKPHGIRGALKVEPLTEDATRFERLEKVSLGPEAAPSESFTVQQIQYQGKLVILSLDEIKSRNAAEEWRNTFVHIPAEDAQPLAEGEHYYYEFIGLKVYTTDETYVGTIDDIVSYPANDVIVVIHENKEILIPDIPEIVKSFDLERGVMIIEPMEGLLE